jgi:hypothetical protein
MTASVVLKSTQDGTELMLCERSNARDANGPESFVVSVKSQNLSAEVQVYGFMSSGLPELFEKMSSSWRGWNGELEWASLEGEFSCAASCDSTGHVTLKYRLRQPYTGVHWELAGAVLIESGQLEGIAREMRAFWDGAI